MVGGYWFYGLSGSGKSFASMTLKNCVTNAFIIDGDAVRRTVSCDLGYSTSDRRIQLNRMLGIAEITFENQYIPIISTVTMSDSIFRKCKNIGIRVCQIVRPTDQLKSVRKLYSGQIPNVVGVDQSLEKLPTETIINNGDCSFERAITGLLE